jgi:MFS family permease
MAQLSQQRVLSFLLLLTPLGQIGIDLYTPSFPGMVRYFATSASMVQATVTVYLVAVGVGQLLYGPLSDSIGRRPAVLLGVLVFLSRFPSQAEPRPAGDVGRLKGERPLELVVS